MFILEVGNFKSTDSSSICIPQKPTVFTRPWGGGRAKKGAQTPFGSGDRNCHHCACVCVCVCVCVCACQGRSEWSIPCAYAMHGHSLKLCKGMFGADAVLSRRDLLESYSSHDYH